MYCCAQLEGEETKQKLHIDPVKRRGRVRCQDITSTGGCLLLYQITEHSLFECE